MKRVFGYIVLLALLGSISVLPSCSTPTAGTETGNPDITACLSTVLQSFDTLDAWVPSTYLPSGDEQLNPNRLQKDATVPVIAKKQTSSDTTAGEIVKNILTTIDTVILFDTQFVDDTLFLDTLIADTVTEISDDGTQTEMFAANYMRYDTVFITDTIVKIDTIVQTRFDTLEYSTAAAVPPPDSVTYQSRTIYINQEADTIAPYTVDRDMRTGEVILVTPMMGDSESINNVTSVTPAVKTGISYLTVSRSTSTDAVQTIESFNFVSGMKTSSVDAFNMSYSPHFHGTILSTAAISEVSVEFDFDSGEDGIYSTTSDNRILSLQKIVHDGGIMSTRISYGSQYFGALSDSVILLKEQLVPSGSIKRQTVYYKGTKNNSDLFNHRVNMLQTYSRAIVYDNVKVLSFSFDITLEKPLKKGNTPTGGALYGVADFGQGISGIIQGVVDFQTGTVYGEYIQAGVKYTFSFNKLNTRAVMERYK